LLSEVGVVVTCRTQEYQELFANRPTKLGLVRAVEILRLSDQQLHSAFVALAEFDDENWEMFVAQPELLAHQQVRNVLKNPLFLNLAVSGRLLPGELLLCDEEQELRDLVLERYLDQRVTADQSQGDPKDVRRYLTWIARFLNGVVVSPFGLKTSDSTVFDLADLTPPDPQKQYRWLVAMSAGLVFGVVYCLGYWLYVGLIELVQIIGLSNWLYYWVFDFLLGPWMVESLVDGLV